MRSVGGIHCVSMSVIVKYFQANIHSTNKVLASKIGFKSFIAFTLTRRFLEFFHIMVRLIHFDQYSNDYFSALLDLHTRLRQWLANLLSFYLMKIRRAISLKLDSETNDVGNTFFLEHRIVSYLEYLYNLAGNHN